MKQRVLGRTGLKVSEVGFGSWAIGGQSYGPVRDEDSSEALEAAWDRGVNFFDTADTYGEGRSETLLGRFLRGKRRDQAVIATKVGWDFYPPSEKMTAVPAGSAAKTNHVGHRKNFEARHLRFACEQSLTRLGSDVIDLYQLHNPSLELIGTGDPVGVLEGLKKEGKIRFIGISVHTEAEALAALQDPRVDAVQVIFNLLDQRMAARVFPEAARRNVGVIAREPLASGLLSGKYAPSHEFPKEDHRRRWVREKREADWEKIRLIRRSLGPEDPALSKAALEFVLAFPEVSTVIPGAKTRTQVMENTAASSAPSLQVEKVGFLKEIYAREPVFRQGLNPR